MRGRPLPTFALLIALLVPLATYPRAGGGQHYRGSGGQGYRGGGSGSSGGGYTGGANRYSREPSPYLGGGGGDLGLFLLLATHPQWLCTLLIIAGVLFYLLKRTNATGRTVRAFEEREAELRTQVSPADIQGWVNTLRLKDPQFDLRAFLEKVERLFGQVQSAWFTRDLALVRPFLSDAMFRRLTVQIKLLQTQGVRNATSDLNVLDIQLIGLDQSEWYDTVHLRIRARIRDVDVPVDLDDREAAARATQVPTSSFVEVWSFVRKPGAQTRIGADLFQGKCPNCGAPYKGGAANNCEYCSAIVNSGNYDWTLSEITQGIEYVRGYLTVDGLLEARKADPALNLEMLQDRASLIFWKWVESQCEGDAKHLAKLATAEYLGRMEEELRALARIGRRRVFLECAVGGVRAKVLRTPPTGLEEAHVEIRWSARTGVGPANEKPPMLPTTPQRWVFTLVRDAAAKTNTHNGMSTSRCPQCHAPLSDSLSSQCDFCKTELSTDPKDWVVSQANSYEQWTAVEEERFAATVARGAVARSNFATDVVLDAHERERLLYLMAAIAMADGVLTKEEKDLLQLCSRRWGVPWPKIEVALSSGYQLFDRLIPAPGSSEAEQFLNTLVRMAMVDGRIDRKERQMLETVAAQVGLTDKLHHMLGGY